VIIVLGEPLQFTLGRLFFMCARHDPIHVEGKVPDWSGRKDGFPAFDTWVGEALVMQQKLSPVFTTFLSFQPVYS
jgi:hypothetical protein